MLYVCVNWVIQGEQTLFLDMQCLETKFFFAEGHTLDVLQMLALE